MTDKEILNILFKDAGVQRSALLAERVLNLEKYLQISEEDLKDIRWVDKEGNFIQMITKQKIDNIIDKRDFYIEQLGHYDASKRIESVAIQLRDKPIIRNFLKYFVSPQQAATIAKNIKTVEALKENFISSSQGLINVSQQQYEDIYQFIINQEKWDAKFLEKMKNQVEILINMLLILGKINEKELSISENKICLRFKRFLLKNWGQIQKEPHLFITEFENIIFDQDTVYSPILNTVISLFKLPRKYFDIAFLFLDKIIVMLEVIPDIAQEAITTGNPFLFRSLFLSFPEAKEFAIGGKLNSSLETKYGLLFEDLMVEFENCRSIFDGGVDVVVGREAFDVKSGPAVMNKSMVNAFAARQKLIQEQRLLPDISTYKIALGYGRREKLNSFMKEIDTEILTGRQAWKKITGVEYSPEIVFAIAGFVARIFGCRSIVNSILISKEKYVSDARDDTEFTKFLSSTFDEIKLTSAAQREIDFVNSLMRT
jgi:hypothetical protein